MKRLRDWLAIHHAIRRTALAMMNARPDDKNRPQRWRVIETPTREKDTGQTVHALHPAEALALIRAAGLFRSMPGGSTPNDELLVRTLSAPAGSIRFEHADRSRFDNTDAAMAAFGAGVSTTMTKQGGPLP